MLFLMMSKTKKGGVNARRLEAVVVDPASNWPLFAEKATRADHQEQGFGECRLLDLGVAQVTSLPVFK